MTSQQQKIQTFRRLHEAPGTFVIPNPWDVGSARMLEIIGFKALASSSAGFAFSCGQPDNHVSRDHVMTHLAALCEATHLPLNADLENGFGESPEAVAETIRLAAATGIAGGSIEDSTGHADHPLFDIGLATDRIRAAVEAVRGLPQPIVLTARAENFFVGVPDLKDTIRRLQAYQEAGAEVLFAPGLKSLDDIRAVVSSVDRPVNVIMGMAGVPITVDQLASLGVKRVSVGGSLARAAYGAFLRGAREIHEHGTFGYADEAVPMSVINQMLAL